MACVSCGILPVRTFRPLLRSNCNFKRRYRCQRDFLPKPKVSGRDDLDALLGEIEIPELEDDLAAFQQDMGATFTVGGVASSYGNDAEALSSLASGVVVVDRSHCGRLRFSGPDRLAFLHGQTTNSLLSCTVGDGCDSVLVTAQARCIDLLTCFVQNQGVITLVSPGLKEAVLERFDKYIFPGDKVEVSDISSKTCQFAVLGIEAGNLLSSMGVDVEDLQKRGHGSHSLLGLSGSPVMVAVGGGLVPGQGFTLITDTNCSKDLWKLLSLKGAIPMGSDAWEIARVVAGCPAPKSELTESYNPLEAGLYHAISFDKGCYIGQETISKVNNLNAVKQELHGLVMNGPCIIGSDVFSGSVKIGKITSYVQTPSGARHALAYLSRKGNLKGKQNLVGLTVEVHSSDVVTGHIVAVPSLTRGDKQISLERQIEKNGDNQEREDKLRAMQERMQAWQDKQNSA